MTLILYIYILFVIAICLPFILRAYERKINPNLQYTVYWEYVFIHKGIRSYTGIAASLIIAATFWLTIYYLST